MTYKQKMATYEAADKQMQMAEFFRTKGDAASVAKCEAKAAELRSTASDQ